MTGNVIACISLNSLIRIAVRVTALVAIVATSSPFLGGADLVENSPFIPDSFNASQKSRKQVTKQPASSALDIEFRGVYSLDGQYHFSIFNKKQNKGEWVSLGETGSTYEVTGFDEDSNSIQLSIDGKTEEITLRAPDNKPIPVQTTATARTRTRQELAAANRAARAKKKPVVRRRVIVPNRKVPAAGQTQTPAQPQRQGRQTRFPGNTQRSDYKTPKEAEELLKQLQARKNQNQK